MARLSLRPGGRATAQLHQIVDRLDALAGPDRVRVFPFDRALFPQGDVVRHFLDQAGIDPDRLTIRRVNESLSMTASRRSSPIAACVRRATPTLAATPRVMSSWRFSPGSKGPPSSLARQSTPASPAQRPHPRLVRTPPGPAAGASHPQGRWRHTDRGGHAPLRTRGTGPP